MASRTGVLDRVERLGREHLAAKSYRELALSEIRQVLRYDAHVWLLTDPVTRVGTSPLADVPGLDWEDLPRLGRLRYLTRVNRWTDLLDEGRTASTLLAATDGDPARSSLWQECLRGLGVSDVASVVCADRFGCWAWLDLWRTGGAAYTTDDTAFLSDLAPVLTRGLREAQARTFVDDAAGLDLAGPAVIVLDTGLTVRTQTGWAAEALLRLNPPDEHMSPIPAAAYNVGAAMLAQEAGIPVGEPRSRVHLGDGRWVTLRADRMTPTSAEPEGDVVVTISVSTPHERREIFALAHGLTPREREVLAEVARGLDSHAIAERLVLSEHTVNDHVKAVLAKTGTATRQALLSRIAGAA
jgi:DNA-binding CsgD family transcriptional regulator